MANYDDHAGVIELLRKAQSVETDVRDKAREAIAFITLPNGQWEESVYHKWEGRPRYTFDRCNDLVDDIAGEMEQADFDIQVKPAGGDATKELAKTYDGLIRNIENLSNAVDVFNSAGRSMVAAGIDGWRVTQRWGDNNSFDQDLYIDAIPDFTDRVWFDPNATMQTREDAEYAFVLQSLSTVAYKEKFPKGSGQSVGSDAKNDPENMPEVVTVGEILYKVRVKRRIVELSNGAVYEDDDNFRKIQDELAAQGATVIRERMREMVDVKTRLFDGGGWLTKAQDTVFDYIPIIPTYGNWRVVRNVPTYWGIVTKKMDAQRVYNYTESRKVEEGALAPLEKIVATAEQIGSHQKQWEQLNTSSDPALLYEHQPDQPPPYKIGGAQINPGLESVSQSMAQNLQSTAGLDQLNGQPVGLQSGVAVELKQNKGDTRNFKYTASQERAICHTAKILIRAIPKVYDTRRQVRIINEDKSFDIVTLNDTIIDEDTGERVTVNDLSKGLYDVTCKVGPAFKNRQHETVNAFREIAEIDPSIIQEGKDIWYGNLNSPGMDLLAERARMNMLMAGLIPPSQMTDEEKELLQNQPEPEPDPVALALEREADNADDKITLEGAKLVFEEKKLAQKAENDKRDDDRASMKEAFENIKVMAQALKDQAAAYKMLAEAKGIEGIELPGVDVVLAQQANVIDDTQAEQP